MGIRESVSIEQLQSAKARKPARRHVTKSIGETCHRCGKGFLPYGQDGSFDKTTGTYPDRDVHLRSGKRVHVGCVRGPKAPTAQTNPAAVKQIQSARANTMGELDKGGTTEPSEELAARGEIGETEKSMQAPLPTKCKGCGAAVDPKWGMCTKNCGGGNVGAPSKQVKKAVGGWLNKCDGCGKPTNVQPPEGMTKVICPKCTQYGPPKTVKVIKAMGDKCMDCGCGGHVMGRCKTSLCKCNSNRMKKGTYVRKQLKKSVVLRRKLA